MCLHLSIQPEEEPDPEERDHFLQQLYKFMEDRGETGEDFSLIKSNIETTVVLLAGLFMYPFILLSCLTLTYESVKHENMDQTQEMN